MRAWFRFAIAALLLPACSSSGGHDGEAPPPTSGGRGWITLTEPTSGGSAWTGEWWILLGGEAFVDAWSYSGQVAPPVSWRNEEAHLSGSAVDQVTWGTFLGTLYPVRRLWHATVPLVGGANRITVEAVSGSNWARTSILVTRPSGQNPPVISIDPIAPGSPPITNTRPLVLHGNASSYVGIARVAWSNAATGGAGVASGTSSWSATLPLALGANPLTATATDNSGAVAVASLSVTYDPSRTGPFPAAPAHLSAQPGDAAVTLTWSEVSGATSYNVYRASAPGVLKSTYHSLPGGGVTIGVASPETVYGLVNGTAWSFVVTAVDAAGEGVESAEVSATPLGGGTAPVTLEAGPVTSTTARLNGALTAPSGYSTSAWFEYGPTPAYGLSTPPQAVAAGSAATLSEDLVGLGPGTQIWFRLAAQNEAGTTWAEGRSFFTPYEPTILASGLDAATALAVDASSVYWLEIYGNSVKKAPTGGGPGTLLASVVLGGNDGALALEGGLIHFAGYSTIWRVGADGDGLTMLLTGLDGVRSLRPFGTSLTWRESGALRRLDVPGGSVTTLMAGSLTFQGGLAADVDGLYWTDYFGGFVYGLPQGGGPVLTLASGLDYPYALVVEAGMLYVAEQSAIRRLSTSGGSPATVLQGISPWFLAQDGTHLYWTNGGTSIRKAPLAGGTVTVLRSGEAGFNGLAVDAASVYWLTPGSRYEAAYGVLKKVPKD